MRLYIAGPMTGYEYFNYPAFRFAEQQLRSAGFDVLNPVDAEQHNTTGAPQAWDWYMRHALRMVVDSDGVALLNGWEQSRGAQLENHVATSLGMPVRPIAGWLA
ncbi:DUF4406 domain-containing protein [Curtobacterium poinsettiae]|uniref:DUF4406 domain-containing protein n=1 Tax=Curtobacterium poinsettiae TaxID=159612 RepID=UPI00217F053C|nr:DUF4406 domain-containing protein [Curtobacterium flaccumfaciens]MCS6578235.1 DUF4406 domain-containing protein [Curtobacterium flaccumfaciens]